MTEFKIQSRDKWNTIVYIMPMWTIVFSQKNIGFLKAKKLNNTQEHKINKE